MAEFSAKDTVFSFLGKVDFRGIRSISVEETQETQGIHAFGSYDPVSEVTGLRSVSGTITFTQQGYYDLVQSIIPAGKRIGDLAAFDFTMVQSNEARVVVTVLQNLKFNGRSKENSVEDGIPVVECPFYARRIVER